MSTLFRAALVDVSLRTLASLERAAVVVAGPALVTLAVACSSTPNPTTDGGGNQVCPTTIAQATASTTKCQVQNTICVVGFPCTPVYQQATCTCDTNTGWSCLLSNGKPVAADTTDTTSLCQPVTTNNPNACPSTPAAGDGTACTNAGQTCFYSGVKCPGDTMPATDNCQCKGNTMGDAGLAWQCEVATCP